MISVFDFMVRTGYWHRIFHTKNIYFVHLGWQLKGPLGYSWLLIGTGKREILLYQNFGHNNCGCYHLEPTAQNNQLYFQRPPVILCEISLRGCETTVIFPCSLILITPRFFNFFVIVWYAEEIIHDSVLIFAHRIWLVIGFCMASSSCWSISLRLARLSYVANVADCHTGNNNQDYVMLRIRMIFEHSLPTTKLSPCISLRNSGSAPASHRTVTVCSQRHTPEKFDW